MITKEFASILAKHIIMANDDLDAVMYEMDDAEYEKYTQLQSQMDGLLEEVHGRVKEANSGRGDYHDESDISDHEYSEPESDDESESDIESVSDMESDFESEIEPQAGSGKHSSWAANVALSLALVTMAIFGQ